MKTLARILALWLPLSQLLLLGSGHAQEVVNPSGGTFSGTINNLTAAYVDASVVPGLIGVGDLGDKVAKAASLATAAGIATIDARGINGAQNCSPQTCVAMFWGNSATAGQNMVCAAQATNCAQSISWPNGGQLLLGSVTLTAQSPNETANITNTACTFINNASFCSITVANNTGNHWVQGGYVTFANIGVATFLEGGPVANGIGGAGGPCVIGTPATNPCQQVWRLQPGTNDTTLVISPSNATLASSNYTSAADTGTVSELGTPALEVPNKGKVIGLGAIASVIQADTTGCGGIATGTPPQQCTNFGVRFASVSTATLPVLSGSGAQCSVGTCWVNMTLMGGVLSMGTAATATFSSPTVTMTAGSNYPVGFAVGAPIVVTGCSAGGDNGSFFIASGGAGTTTLTITNAGGAAASGCTVLLANGMVPATQQGELMQIRSLTTGTFDTNFMPAAECANGNIAQNGGCPLSVGAAKVATGYHIMFYNKDAVSTSNGGFVFAGTPLLAMSQGGVIESPMGAQNTIPDGAQVQITGVALNCRGVPGCESAQNATAEEESFIFWSTFMNSSFAAFDIHNGGASGASNSGPYMGNQVILQAATACDYDTVGIYWSSVFTRDVFGGTIVNNPGCALAAGARTTTSAFPKYAIMYDSSLGGVSFRGWHAEGFNVGFAAGLNRATQGFEVAGWLGHSLVQTCVLISQNFSNIAHGGANFTSDITVSRIATGSNGCPAATILDEIQQITNNDAVTGNYVWDRTGGTDVNGTGLNTIINTDPNFPIHQGGNNFVLAAATAAIGNTQTNLAGLAFTGNSNTKYVLTCTVGYLTSAVGAGLQMQVTGPAIGAGSILVTLNDPNSASTVKSFTQTAFGSPVGGTTSTTATPSVFSAIFTATMTLGATSGTVQVQAAAGGAGTVTVSSQTSCHLEAM